MTYQREFNEYLNVAIVGVGDHSYRNILPVMHHLPVRLRAVCDLNEDLAKITASQFGCRSYSSTAEMYEREQLDAVFLCLSPRLHPKLAIEAFDAGLHVWMEKPVAIRAYQVEEMIEKQGDRVANVGFKKAFMPSTDKAIEMVQSKQFGALQSILGVYPMSIPENGREVLDSMRAVDWLANGVHPLSLMMAVGGKIDAVTVHRSRTGKGLCYLEFASGAIGNFHLASGPQPVESYKFFGENWHLEIENSLRVKLTRGIPFNYSRTHNYVPEGTDSGTLVWEPQNCLATLENKALFTQGMYGELKYFCDSALNNLQGERGSLAFALELMKVYEAALVSEGKTIII